MEPRRRRRRTRKKDSFLCFRVIQTQRRSYQNSRGSDREMFVDGLVFHVAQFVVSGEMGRWAWALPYSNCLERTNFPFSKTKWLKKKDKFLHKKYVHGLTYPGARWKEFYMMTFTCKKNILQDRYQTDKLNEHQARGFLVQRNYSEC